MIQAKIAITPHFPCAMIHSNAVLSQVSTTGAMVTNRTNSAPMTNNLIKFPNISFCFLSVNNPDSNRHWISDCCQCNILLLVFVQITRCDFATIVESGSSKNFPVFFPSVAAVDSNIVEFIVSW